MYVITNILAALNRKSEIQIISQGAQIISLLDIFAMKTL